MFFDSDLKNSLMKNISPSGLYNDTEENKRYELNKYSWIGVQFNNIILFLITLWIIGSFYLHGKRKGTWKPSNNNKSSKVLLSIALVTSCLTLCKLITTQMIIIYNLFATISPTSNIWCTAWYRILEVLYYFCLLSLYGFFWYRQKILYSQSLFKPLNTKTIKAFSWFSLFIFTIMGSSLVISHFITTKYVFRKLGCTAGVSKQSVVYLYIVLVLTLLSQFILFGLFVYPLLYYKKNRKNCDKRVDKGTNEKISRATRLATASMSACILAHILTLVLTAFIPSKLPIVYGATVFDLSLVVNLIALMISFEDYKMIAKGFFIQNESRKNVITSIALSTDV